MHAAECFTTGASAISHHTFGNIDKRLFRRLVLPGMLGAAIGAYVLVQLAGGCDQALDRGLPAAARHA